MPTHPSIPKPLEITHGCGVNSVAFSPDGSYFVTGCNEGDIHQWRISDGKRTTMKVGDCIFVVAISSDGRWIVSGGLDCQVTVWDAKTQQRIFESTHVDGKWITALDVSPGSTRFASASSDCTVNVWSLTTGQRLLPPLRHSNLIACVAFSPDGDHVATAGVNDCLRIWDSRDGDLVLDVPDFFPESLVWWRDNRIFASSSFSQRWIDTSLGSTLLELPRAGGATIKGHLAVPRNRNLLANLDQRCVRLWDHAAHAWGPITLELGYNGCTIAISPDNRHLVTGGEDRISIWHLPYEIQGGSSHNDAFIHLTDAVWQLWFHGKLESTMEVLSRDIALNGRSYDALAKRALVHARLQEWVGALDDAEMAVDVQLSVIGCIAKSVALCGQGKHGDSMQAFDLGFSVCNPEHVRYLLLVKSVILFLGGFHDQAIARANDLIKYSPDESFRCVQTYMSVLVARSAIESKDYEHAVRILTSAAAPGEFSELPELLTISLITGWNFDALSFEVHHYKCEALFAAGLTSGAVASFLEMDSDVQMKLSAKMEWATDFRKRCINKLNELGDIATNSAAHCDAVAYYSSALTLDPLFASIIIKRSVAYAAMSQWESALQDANEAIMINPSQPWSYKAKHIALHGAGCYDEAIEALDNMLLKIEQSPDPHTRDLRKHYVSTSQSKAVILSFAKRIQRDFPLVLIDTKDGHIYSEHERMRVFETDSQFKQLVSSMVSQIDNAVFEQAVREYFRYATFSHTWDEDEPLFHEILHESVHNLTASPKMVKLLMFCTIAREAGFRWAWSDTCCINKSDGAALQESLTSMFQWYHESSLTVVHLKGVLSDSELGALVESLWNTRAWTLQEFFASKVIRFYTEDWRVYLPHEAGFNHKESPVVMREMALATGLDAKELLSLRPGSENVRQKLRLASTRFATKQEDVAYSLFGIFDVSIPVTYGEGQRRAIGRLLQEVLTRSGDATILAWTGKASDYNSCLPSEIAVYREPLSPHVPSPIPDDEMETALSELQMSSALHDSAMELYDRLLIQPTPRLVSRRLSLACIVFLLRTVSGPFVADDDPSMRVYRATAAVLEEIEIRTSDDLSSPSNLVLVHPWLQSLFDPVLPHEDMIASDEESLSVHVIPDTDPSPSGRDPAPILIPHTLQPLQLASPLDKSTRALRLFVRLRQPFGALLLAPHSPREYKRVATDRPIVVSIRKEVSPQYFLDKIRILDIL